MALYSDFLSLFNAKPFVVTSNKLYRCAKFYSIQWFKQYSKHSIMAAKYAKIDRVDKCNFFFFQILVPLRSLGLLRYLLKWSSAHVYARRCKQGCKLQKLMKSLNKTETPIFYLQCVLCFQRQHFRDLFLLRMY